MGNSIYGAFRTKPIPALYEANKTAVTADVLEVGLIFATLILFISLIAVVIGSRGKDILFSLFKVLVGVFITAGIMLANFGQEWEHSEIHTKTQYRAGTKHEIEANIGVKIGLRSVNITLTGDPIYQKLDNLTTERVDYNERFSWSGDGWHLGRAGFGPNAGSFNREFRAGQYKGLPYPILWIAEYFTIDGEGIRWGRHYLQAGFYTHVCVWLAFPLWLLALITINLVTRYGGYLMVMTGGTLILGNILFATIRNANDLVIPFEDAKLEFKWGPTFYLNLFTGLISLIIGVVLIIMDLFYKEYLASFLTVDVLDEYEEYYATSREVEKLEVVSTGRRPITIRQNSQPGDGNKIDLSSRNGATMNNIPNGTSGQHDEDEIYENPERIERLFKRKVGWAQRGTIAGKISKSRKVKKRPQPGIEDDDNTATVYENTENLRGAVNAGYDDDQTANTHV